MGMGRLPGREAHRTSHRGLVDATMAALALGCAALLLLHGVDTSFRTTALTASACAEAEGEAGEAEGELEDSEPEFERGTESTGSEVSDFYAGPGLEVHCSGLPGSRHPESFAELAVANSSRLTRTVAP